MTPSTSQILSADYLIPMDGSREVIRDGAILIENDRIVRVGEFDTVRADFPEAPIQTFRNQLLMPGLVNAHAHSGLLRGTAEGLAVWEWLQAFIDPMHRVLKPEDAEAASWLCYAEALLSGTTTIVDMWRFMDGSARAASQLGNRVVLVPYVGEHPDFDYFDHLDQTEELLESWHGKAEGRVQVWVGLEHAFYATERAHERAINLAKRYETGFHTHSNEAEIELQEMARRYGTRSIPALEKLGLLDAPRTLLAHCVWLDDDEIALMAKRKIGVAHNPTSNMKLASGAAPVLKLRAAGVNVGIGTDGEKENNNLDMFEEMKFASLLTKLAAQDASALDSWEVLEMATIEGARSLGMDSDIGSLEPGKQADVIAVRLDTPRMTPIVAGAGGNIHQNLVFGGVGRDVVWSMVAGKIVVENGRLKNSALQEIIDAVNRAAPGLFARRAEWLARNHTVSAIAELA